MATTPYLISRAGGRQLALALSDVGEVMRPLPVTRFAGAPPFVLGTAVVRGRSVPVVDAAALFGTSPAPPSRFVSVRLGPRGAVLAVEEVVGVRTLSSAELESVPPLLHQAAQGVPEAVAALDRELLLVLRAGRLVPDAVWRTLEGDGAS